MNDFTTEIVQTLVTKGDLNELFRLVLVAVLILVSLPNIA